MRQTTNKCTGKFRIKGKLLLSLIAITALLVLSGCGGGGAEGGGSDQKADAKPTTDGIRGTVYTVPEGWTKTDVSKDNNNEYSNPDYDLVIGVSSIDDSNLHHFADVEKFDTVDQFYKYCTSPSKDSKYEKEFEDTKLLGQDAKTSKIKKDDGYVDVATYCIMDGVMYDFYIQRTDAYDNDSKIKSDAKPLSEEEMSIYEAFRESAEAGDGAKLQMEGVTADGIGEITFDTPEGYELTDVAKYYVSYENSDGVAISASMIDQENFDWYTDDNGKPYKNLDDLYNYFKSTEHETEKEDCEIAGQKGFRSKTDGEFSTAEAVFKTDKAIYEFYIYAATGEEDTLGNLTEDDIAAFDGFLNSVALK